MNRSSLFPLRRPWVAGLALVLGALAGAVSTASAQLSAGTVSPGWSLRDLSGKFVNSDEFKGKVVILNFWATWCAPCRAEIPGFVELHQRYADKGLVIVGISLDRKGSAAVSTFKEKFGMNYRVVMGDERVVKAFGGIEALPTTFVIDRAGKIARVHVGYADAKTFEEDVKPLL